MTFEAAYGTVKLTPAHHTCLMVKSIKSMLHQKPTIATLDGRNSKHLRYDYLL
jgi:hypothetical protein